MNNNQGSLVMRRVPSLFVLAAAGLAGVTAEAADTYFQPRVEARGETHSNRDLSTVQNGPDSNVQGYLLDLEAIMGAVTARSDTVFRPRLRIQEFPDRDDLKRVEGSARLESTYYSERGQVRMEGTYERRDSYNAELSEAAFDDLDPNDPGGENGRLRTGETRERIRLAPSAEFELSERTGVGIRGDFDRIDYSSKLAVPRSGYRYMEGEAFIRRELTQRASIELGGFAGNNEEDDDSSETDTYGGRLTLANNWTERFDTEVRFDVEHSKVKELVAPTSEFNSTDVGVEASGTYSGEVSRLRFTIGRDFEPSGERGRKKTDEFRLQYDRDLSQRLRLQSAVRHRRERGISAAGNTDNRDYTRGEISLRWRMTRFWFVSGGYNYTRQDIKSLPNTADNHSFFVSVGYQGLGRQAPRRRR